MKILENITNEYKRIATGIAIVLFLTVMYIALIPGASVAAQSFVMAASGTPIAGAFVKIVEWPQYNATTNGTGVYTMPNVPYDANGSTYTLRFSAPGYGSNSSSVTLNSSNSNPAVSMDLYPSEPQYMPYLDDRDTRWASEIQVFNPYDFNITADVTAYNLLNGQNTTVTFETPINKLGTRYAEQVVSGDFVGSVKVVSTRPQSIVQGVLKSLVNNVYSIAPSRKIPATNVQYLPYLDDRDTRWDSGIQIFNPYDNTITATLTGYNLMNGQNTTLSFDIPARSFGSRFAGEVAGGAQGANVDFVGTMIVNTSQPALVQGAVRTIQKGVTSMAPAVLLTTDNVRYLPYLDDRDTRWDSGVQVFNPYDNTITATLTGYNLMNGQNTTLSFDIPAKSFGSRFAGEVAGGAQGANVDFVGTMIVNTSQPALVQGAVRSITEGVTSMAPAVLLTTATTQYIPFMNDTGTVFDSGIQIFNPQNSTITATLTGYNILNGQTTTLSFDIPAKSFGSRFAGELAGGAQGANVDFVGSARVVTSQPALVQAAIRNIGKGVTSMAPAVVLQ